MLAILWLSWKRMTARPMMTLMALFGLTVSVGLMVSVPLYADGINFSLLEERLSNQTERNGRPPFAYLYSYVGSWHGPLNIEEVEPLTDYFRDEAASTLRLNQDLFIYHYETGDFRLFPADVTRVTDRQLGIDIVKLTYTSEIERFIELTDGQMPVTVAADQPYQVLVRDILADEYDLRVGTEYVTYDLRSPLGRPQTIPIEVVGIWQPIDPDDPFWLYNPDAYRDRLIVPLETWRDQIAPQLSDEIFQAAWYLVLDGSRITTGDVDGLLAGAATVEATIAEMLPNTGPLQSPVGALEGYRRDVRQLTNQLFAFNIPTVGLAFAFLALVMSLIVDERRNEIAVMRSRGNSASGILTRFLVEGLLLGGVALLIGSGLALIFSFWMGRVRSFLDFSSPPSLRILMVPSGWLFGAGTILVFLIISLLMMRGATHFTIVTLRASQSRQIATAWWQAIYLDVILLGVALAGTWQLTQQNGAQTEGLLASSNIFDNPILFLLPVLFILSAVLIFLRFFPLLLAVLNRLLVFTNQVGPLQAVRNLARTPSFFTTPFILLGVTVSLSVYIASLARTLDFQIFDETWYAVGADLNLFTSPTPFGDESRFGFVSMEDNTSDTFIFLPPSEYEAVDGIEAVTRVGRYPATVSGSEAEIEYLGIEYDSFPDIAYWREDFSRYRIHTLMNSLAYSEEGVLVSEQFLERHNLQPGDPLELMVALDDGQVLLSAQITGSFDLFPTWYPGQEEEIIVGRIETLFEAAGSEFPYRLWINTSGELDDDQLQEDLFARGIIGSNWEEPYSRILTAQVAPARQGLFGLLSIGFVAAVILTFLGFFLYIFFSFQKRVVELGILRAVGLHLNQIIGLLAWELALLMGSGLLWGGLIGILSSFLFIPYLQVGRDPTELVPPYLVEIAWVAIGQILILFVILFLLVVLTVSILLSRMQLFEAIKLGETV